MHEFFNQYYLFFKKNKLFLFNTLDFILLLSTNTFFRK